jgi:hypothetical protein
MVLLKPVLLFLFVSCNALLGFRRVVQPCNLEHLPKAKLIYAYKKVKHVPENGK